MGIFQNSLLAGAAAAAASGGDDVVVPGYLYAWGRNNYGQIGNGTTSNSGKTSPIQVGSDKWIDASCGLGFNIGIMEDLTLWGWGRNNVGQLGQGNTTDYSSPVQIGSAENWSKCAAGNYHTLVVNSDGEIWNCGSGAGAPGNTLGQIGSLTDWKRPTAGANRSGCVKTDGTLWMWGNNANGSLGDGTTTEENSPIQIGSNTNWKIVTTGNQQTLAVTTDGTLWGWGSNNLGQLAQGNTTNYSSPVQIGSDTTWSHVHYSPRANTSNALKTDTLWSFGSNGEGILGVGNTTNYSSPVQVGSASDWFDCLIGEMAAFGIRGSDNSGEWFSWGGGFEGGLGVGNQNSYSSPVQVGSETDWIKCCGMAE